MSQEGVARPEPSSFYTKPTYTALSEAINDAVRRLGEFNTWEVKTLDHLKDQLFLSPRLKQWIGIGASSAVGREYRIYNASHDVWVSVYENKVLLVYNSGGKEHQIISDPLACATLFKNIADAQAYVQSAPVDDTVDEEFFGSGDVSGADLDAALEEHHSEPFTEEDAELIEEVCADGTPGQIAVEDEEDVEADETVYHTIEPEPKNYVGQINKFASSEAVQIKAEYKDKPQKSKAANDELAQSIQVGRSAFTRLKSLQGRVLTIVDASPITDKAQRDAVKSLISKEFRRDMNQIKPTYSDEE